MLASFMNAFCFWFHYVDCRMWHTSVYRQRQHHNIFIHRKKQILFFLSTLQSVLMPNWTNFPPRARRLIRVCPACEPLRDFNFVVLKIKFTFYFYAHFDTRKRVRPNMNVNGFSFYFILMWVNGETFNIMIL